MDPTIFFETLGAFVVTLRMFAWWQRFAKYERRRSDRGIPLQNPSAKSLNDSAHNCQLVAARSGCPFRFHSAVLKWALLLCLQ